MKGDFSRLTDDPKKHYSGVLMQQGRVQLDADWNEQQAITQRRIETEARDVIGPCGAPKDNAGFEIKVEATGLTIGVGRYYVDGILCENEQVTENEASIPYAQQPHLINPPDPKTVLTAEKPVGIVYLDVWQRHITALNDPHIREAALGGPDTASRNQTVWQVKIRPVTPAQAGYNCDSNFAEWDALIAPGNATLKARVQPPGMDDPCMISPTAGYQRLENQLYRLEIHKSGVLGAATFKWSRDNGSVATSIDEVINSQVIKVHDVGPDSILGFASGQLVEITDDQIELNGALGQLFKILEVNAATNEITLDTAPSTIDASRHPKLRRWDSDGEITVARPMSNDGWLGLEGGIEVQFSDGDYHTGDYWLIPARTATGRIEWPPFDPPDATPIPQPPLGIEHHYCRLALIVLAPSGLQVSEDCRSLFPPLTEVGGAAIHVTAVNLNVNNQTLHNDSDVPVNDFVSGIDIVCDTEVFPDSLTDNPVCIITLDLPFPFNAADRQLWGEPVIGFQPVILAANVGIGATANHIKWFPALSTRSWLLNQLFTMMRQFNRGARVLAHLTLKGNFVFALHDSKLYLDGEVFGFHPFRPEPNIEVRFPSGDGRRGGDLEMWFWLVNQCPTITVNPATLPNGAPDEVYSQTLMATSGTAPYTFVVTSGALPTGLTLSAGGSLSGRLTQLGTFTFMVRVTDQNNCVGDRTYTVMICQPPAITTQPTSRTVSPGAPVNFSVTATGTNLSYQWRKNGVNIPGATSSSFTINAVVPGDAGRYDVVVTDACGSATSNAATLTVNPLPNPTIEVTPPNSFGDVCPGSSKTLPLTIKNTGGSDLHVSSITPSPPEFTLPEIITFPLTIPPSDPHDVTIRFAPVSFGNKLAEITITSDDPAKPSVKASVAGVAPPPVILVDNTLDFGNVSSTNTVSKNLTIRNTGNCELMVSSVILTGSPEFKVIGPVTFKVRPNSHSQVVITFTPTEENIDKMQSGQVRINSNDPANPVKTVTVTGTLVAL